MTQILVIAKEAVPGRVKTRLCPPFTIGQAARLAAAALEDTLRTVAATPVRHRVLALQGRPGLWLPGGFVVIPQRGRGLDQRLAAAFTDTHRLHPMPTVLIGMDTPQLTSALLQSAATALASHDAVYGPAADGGFWLLGLRRPILPELRDVDTAADACQVAAEAPGSRFTMTLEAIRRETADITHG
jgi:glycosyltransferase A (GT-A) superfamily protein (DUF2064 family)